MCTVVILRRPEHAWPVLLAANRDEMADRPWLPPGRHWPDQPWARAGLDQLANGSWMGVNDTGVVAAILNRMGTLGPQAGKRSRGELVLEALDHHDAVDAAEALQALDGRSYRPFNMVIADNRDAFWLRADGSAAVRAFPIPAGLHMISALDLDDPASARIARYAPRFAAAAVPQPDQNDWTGWISLLADGGDGALDEESPAMCFRRPNGFGTVSSTLLALPAMGRDCPPHWLFSSQPPGADTFMHL